MKPAISADARRPKPSPGGKALVEASLRALLLFRVTVVNVLVIGTLFLPTVSFAQASDPARPPHSQGNQANQGHQPGQGNRGNQPSPSGQGSQANGPQQRSQASQANSANQGSRANPNPANQGTPASLAPQR